MMMKYLELYAEMLEIEREVICFKMRQVLINAYLSLRRFREAAEGLLKCYTIAVSQNYRAKEREVMPIVNAVAQSTYTEVLKADDVDVRTV
jgi:hypothetical protein